jgi:hypothetical protein
MEHVEADREAGHARKGEQVRDAGSYAMRASLAEARDCPAEPSHDYSSMP